MPALGKKLQVQIQPGVSPKEDFTELDSFTYVNSDKVRFQNGRLRKLKGWVRLFSDNFQRIYGCARAMYSYTPGDGFERVLIGTSTSLYVFYKGAFYNITPLITSTTAIANALGTVYLTDAGYSVSTTAGSDIATFNIPNFLNPDDTVKISGVTGTIGGISSTNFNGTFTVIATPSSGTFQVLIAVPAVSNDTGGGTSIQFVTKQLLVTLVDHGFGKGDRIKITGSAAVGGITAPHINMENVVSAVISPDVFAITTMDFATSLVTAGGGADVLIQGEITGGPCDQSQGYGYGGGLYGVGLYGVPKLFAIAIQYPRVWSFDLFNDGIIMCPGNQGGIYLWAGDISTAPVLQTNAPLANWVYQSNSMVVALGPNGDNGTFTNSNLNDANDWVFDGVSVKRSFDVAGASTFVSQTSTRNVDVLFTNNKVYQVRFVDLPHVWVVSELFATDGLIAPKARVNIEDSVVWQGWGDFYVFNGTSVTILPKNTIKRYVYDNLNLAQAAKFFACAQPDYNEIWFFYCAGQDNEPNNYAINNYREQHWTIGTLERTAAAEPASGVTPTLLIQSHVVNTVKLANNPLSTNFYTLGTDPITAANTSSDIVITITGHHLEPGDSIVIAGSSAVHGITALQINTTQTVTSVTVGTITVTTAGTATSSGTGGGSSITVGTQIVTASYTNHFRNNDEVTIDNATTFCGLLVGDLNGTFSVRRWTATTFDFAVGTDYSTSQATGGGPGVQLSYSRTGRLFEHNVGVDDYDGDNCDIGDPTTCVLPMNSFAETNYGQIGEGDNTMLIYSVIPDSTQVGTMNLTVTTKLYPQGTPITKGPFPITPATIKVDVQMLGRQRKYRIASNALGQDFITGKWFEQVIESTPI